MQCLANAREGAYYERYRLSHGELYEGENPNRVNLTLFALVIEGLVQTLFFWTLYQYCTLWAGHNLADAGSHFGPESGTEHLACNRCGWSWSHTWY